MKPRTWCWRWTSQWRTACLPEPLGLEGRPDLRATKDAAALIIAVPEILAAESSVPSVQPQEFDGPALHVITG
jgi:hypothetical protein